MAQATNERTVVGVFEDYTKADNVVRDLQDAGIPRESIQLQSNFKTGAAGRSGYDEEPHEGGISGFFHRLFGDNDDADNYAEAHRRGHAIVSVTAPQDQMERVVDIMNSAGAVDIDRRVEQFRQTGYERYDPNAAPYDYDQAAREREQYRSRSDEGKSIPVVEEELQVGKRMVQRGGVRVYSRVVNEPASETVELREEHVRVDRRPADRNLTEAEMQGLRDQTIEVVEMAEEPVIQKRSRVKEEVVVGKETTSRKEKVSENLRRTEVEVEQLGKGEARRDVERNRVANDPDVAGAYARTADYSDDFRRDWESRYASSGEQWDTYRPAYDYGYRSASDPQYKGRDWNDVEETLRTDYLRQNPNSSWDRMKGAVRYGWEKMTGKR